jgi:hypothetical protein
MWPPELLGRRVSVYARLFFYEGFMTVSVTVLS